MLILWQMRRRRRAACRGGTCSRASASRPTSAPAARPAPAVGCVTVGAAAHWGRRRPGHRRRRGEPRPPTAAPPPAQTPRSALLRPDARCESCCTRSCIACQTSMPCPKAPSHFAAALQSRMLSHLVAAWGANFDIYGFANAPQAAADDAAATFSVSAAHSQDSQAGSRGPERGEGEGTPRGPSTAGQSGLVERAPPAARPDQSALSGQSPTGGRVSLYGACARQAYCLGQRISQILRGSALHLELNEHCGLWHSPLRYSLVVRTITERHRSGSRAPRRKAAAEAAARKLAHRMRGLPCLPCCPAAAAWAYRTIARLNRTATAKSALPVAVSDNKAAQAVPVRCSSISCVASMPSLSG